MKSQSNWGRVDKVDYEPEKSLFKAFLHIGSLRICSSVTDEHYTNTTNLCKTICDSQWQNAEANIVEKSQSHEFKNL